MSRALAFAIFSLVLLGACSPKETSTTAHRGRVSPTYQGPSESGYCSTPVAYGGSTVTVEGLAKYIRRETYNNPVGNPTFEGLGSALTTHATLPAGLFPIRAAEVRVTDAGGAVVQCGQTHPTTGAFSVVLPAGNTDYTVSVNSRSAQFNGGSVYMNASVLNKPEANQFYSLSTTVNAGGGNVNVGTLTATAVTSGAMLGAAFNILDQIFAANEYLRSKVANCSGSYTGCTNVSLTSPVRKVFAYWEKGFNPNDYFGSSSGLSFYLPGFYRLFILGGVQGDIDHADTDHFDNSVILHEYGHFLEDAMFISDSPGGAHNGNKVIDPRLAWSEGWGNFVQAAILTANGTMSASAPRYFDSSGNLDGTADLFFEVDLENHVDKDLIVSGAGEGNFREFAVTRFLMDVVDGTNAADSMARSGNPGLTYNDNISDNFSQLWAALTKNSGHGLRQSTLAFRQIGHMLLGQQDLPGASNWSSIRTGNYQTGDTTDYAQYVAAPVDGGNCANIGGSGYDFSIDPEPVPSTTSLSNSNLFVNNDFYHLKIAAGGSQVIQLRYKEQAGAQAADLDLYVYKEDSVFASGADMAGRSFNDPTASLLNEETETVSVSLAPGNYLINVNAYTGAPYHNAGLTYYSLYLNGVRLCPRSL